MRKGPLERLGIESPGQEPDPPGEARGRCDQIELTLQPGSIATTAATDEAEAAAVGHRCGECTPSNVTHRGQRHGVRHAKQLRECGPHRHPPFIARSLGSTGLRVTVT